MIALSILATLCAGVVLARCICILDNMDHRRRDESYLRFLAFGLSYVFLAVASLSAMFLCWDGVISLSGILFLLSSAGLILFDRRKKRDCFRAETCRLKGKP